MKLKGDEQGIEALKFYHDSEEKKEYLKMILNEARTNTNNTTEFKDTSDNKYTLVFDPASGEFTVEKV
jgi:hypothetical protein